MDELTECVVEIAPTIEELTAEFAALETQLKRNTRETRLRQGEILLEIKLALPPGGFYKFLAEFGWSERTARSYMQQAKEVLGLASPTYSGGDGVAKQSRSPSLRHRLREVVTDPGVRRGVQNAIVPLALWDKILEILKVKEDEGAQD
jgi:hypothetical protein